VILFPVRPELQSAETSHNASAITKIILSILVFLSALTFFVDRSSSGEPFRAAKELATQSCRGQRLMLVCRWDDGVAIERPSQHWKGISIVKRHKQLIDTKLRAIRSKMNQRIVRPVFDRPYFPDDAGQDPLAHS
jgi:hypothetical protein